MPTKPLSTSRTLALLLLLPLLVTLSPSPASAQPDIGSFGFGLILGDPTGLTAKGSIGGGNAWDLGVGTGYLGSFRVHGDYLWNINAFSSSEVGLYLGLGAVIGSGNGRGFIVRGKEVDDDDGFRLGLRGVAGINAMPFSAPVELFLEVAPIIAISPSGTGTDVAIGIRYYP